MSAHSNDSYSASQKHHDNDASSKINDNRGDDICCVCDKRVYPMERVFTDKRLYHKQCFKCHKCKRVLGADFAMSEGVLYCKPHFMEMLRLGGGYCNNTVPQPDTADADNSHVEVEDELPTHEFTKSMLAKFRELEKGKNPPLPITSVAARSPAIRNKEWKTNFHAENDVNETTTTEANGSIVRSGDANAIIEHELPPPDTAKSMAAKFKAMENAGPIPTPEGSRILQQKAREGSGVNANVRLPPSSFTTSNEISTNEDQYNNDSVRHSTVSENQPEIPSDDVIRHEIGEIREHELPEAGITRNLLARFQNTNS